MPNVVYAYCDFKTKKIKVYSFESTQSAQSTQNLTLPNAGLKVFQLHVFVHSKQIIFFLIFFNTGLKVLQNKILYRT